MKLLARIQQLLGEIVDVEPPCDVREFVVTDRRRLPPGVGVDADGGQDEALFATERDGELALSLYLAPAVLRRLARHDPLRRLDGDNVADWWTVLEGVSHFLYLTRCAGHDRAVDVLELELQAEVDKYVATAWLLRAQSPGHLPLELHPLLFERTRIDPARAGARANLYAAASRHAGAFCRRLEQGLRRGRAASDAPLAREPLRELRRFYRFALGRKIEAAYAG